MASAPAFAATPIVGAALASATADTSYTAPTNVATLTFAPAVSANGAKIDAIRVLATATTVLGLVNIFLYDNATYHFVDSFVIPVITVSTTVPPVVAERTYDKLWLPAAASWSLRFTVSIAGLQSIIKVVAFGGNF